MKAARAAATSILFIAELLGVLRIARRFNVRAGSAVARPVDGEGELLAQDRPYPRRLLRAERVGRGLLHVDALGHLELHGMHAVGGLSVAARDVAALEAAVQHLGEIAMPRERGLEARGELGIA